MRLLVYAAAMQQLYICGYMQQHLPVGEQHPGSLGHGPKRQVDQLWPAHGGGGGHGGETKKARQKGRQGKAAKAERGLAGPGYMPSEAPAVVKSRGPAVVSTFDSDAHIRRPRVGGRMPQSFTAMSPRHADEDESNTDEYADDEFEEAEVEPVEGDSEEPTEEELEDSMLNEMLDELHSRKNSDVQKRMNEHGRNWRLVNSKANNELSEKLEDQTRQREERAHSKLRVAKTTEGGSGSAAAKVRARAIPATTWIYGDISDKLLVCVFRRGGIRWRLLRRRSVRNRRPDFCVSIRSSRGSWT